MCSFCRCRSFCSGPRSFQTFLGPDQPFFAATGCHPVLPLDPADATDLFPALYGLVSTAELIGARAWSSSRTASGRTRGAPFTKHGLKRRVNSSAITPKPYATSTFSAVPRPDAQHPHREVFKPEDATAVSRPLRSAVPKPRRCVHPVRTRRLDRPISAFRFLPYFGRERIELAWLDDAAHLDISTASSPDGSV